MRSRRRSTSTPGNDISTQDVGASWGEQVAKRALTGLVVFLVLVVLFIWAYFREWKMSVAALVALAHDIVITIGVYALSGFEVTPATVTGLLTILGFSLYDTVVVFDKVRENTKNLRQSRRTYAELANLAVNQTLVRSINTSIVALLPVGAILYVGVVTLGSGALKDLALALFVGMAAGAYSSIFIATPLAVQLKSRREGDHPAGRPGARRAPAATSTATPTCPSFTEDMPVRDDRTTGSTIPTTEEPDEEPVRRRRRRRRRPEASGSGRVVPDAEGAAAATRARPDAASRPGSRAPSAASERADDRERGAERPSATLIAARVRDIPDFPKPGVTFKDITPLLDDHAAFTLGGRGAGRGGSRRRRRRRGRQGRRHGGPWLHPRGARWRSPSGVGLRARSASPASCRGRRERSATTWSTAARPSRCTSTPSTAGERVLVVDDVLATGGTARATAELVEQAGATVHGLAMLLELSFLPGRETIGDLPLTVLHTV